jgi:transcriptional regulator with XRE-family HTH domain
MTHVEMYHARQAKFPTSERIRSARLGKNLSLQDLSELTLGMLSKSRISNYEQGIRKPSAEVACILAEALDASPAWLLGLED